MNKLERISSILVKLQSGSVVTAQQIADQFAVSLRTVYRDIKVLEESGIPIIGEAGVGYSLIDGFKLSPLMFSTEEAISFLMAEKLVSRQSDGDMYQLYRSGMDKIRAVLKTVDKNILEDFDSFIQIPAKHVSPQNLPSLVLPSLLHCIINRKVVKIEYHANYNGETTYRNIEPLGFFFMINNWYVIAWCRKRKDYRTFNLSRIRQSVPNNENFENTHPPLKSLLDKIYADNVVYKVKVKVQRPALRNMGMTKYVFGLTLEEEFENYTIQHYQTHSLESLARWYLSFADQATILEPTEFKHIVKELINNIIHLYTNM